MTANVARVGMREFRAHLQQYLLTTSVPVAVTRHGETVGFYIPARHFVAINALFTIKSFSLPFH